MMRWIATIKRWLRATGDAMLPRRCAVCGATLTEHDRWLCPTCLSQLPLTGFHLTADNRMEMLFRGQVLIERATALFYYHRGDPYASILHDIKYRSTPQLGKWLAARYTRQLMDCGWMSGIDVVVPVPIHRSKLAQRGYNQSEYLARGIAEQAGIHYMPALRAVKQHSSQTHMNAVERHLNVAQTFGADTQLAATLGSSHVLLVDDVVTTGSTLIACGKALREAAPDIRLSVFTLAAAQLS